MTYYLLRENLAWLRKVMWQQMGIDGEWESPIHVIPSWRWALENADSSGALSPWRLYAGYCDPMLEVLRLEQVLYPNRYANCPRLPMDYAGHVEHHQSIANEYLSHG
jgi:hypothetical protein